MAVLVACLASLGPAAAALALEPPARPGSRGYLTTPEELRDIARKAKEGIEPYRKNVADLLEFVGEPDHWPHGELSGEVTVRGGSSSKPEQLSDDAAKLVYGKAIAYHLTDDERFAASAREHILDFTDTTFPLSGTWNDGNQIILNLARGGTPYIYAADLLEPWEGWSESDKRDYQRWLGEHVYPLVSWTSRVRKNNWGTAGSLAAAAIADYLHDADWTLREQQPVQTQMSPAEAYRVHNALQVGRQSGDVAWKMDAKTPEAHGLDLWGILPSGGIPEEIRRGDNAVDAPAFSDSDKGTSYTQSYIEHLTAHAEMLRRRGDSSLYDMVFDDGSGSLLQAYRYVLDNPHGSHPFSDVHISALYIAHRYYQHPGLRRSLEAQGPGDIEGHRLALFGRLTHDFDPETECPAPPPVVPPPGGFAWPLDGPGH